jgi:hypothetical protein
LIYFLSAFGQCKLFGGCSNGLSVSEQFAGGIIQSTITAHAVTADQQRKFEEKFAKFMYTTLTPLARLSSPELKAALAVLGATPPGRKHAGGRLLDEAYDRVVQNIIAIVARCKVICITMDGWKKRGCEQGAPLITVVLLLPDGTSQFWKVRIQLSFTKYRNATDRVLPGPAVDLCHYSSSVEYRAVRGSTLQICQKPS